MTIRLGVVMDPIGSIHYHKDSTLAMLCEAQQRGWEIFYFELSDLFLLDGVPHGQAKRLHVTQNEMSWYEFDGEADRSLADLSIILMRKDPPVNEAYLHATRLLDLAEQRGVLVVNRPQSLRDANEKLFTAHFPQCTPPTLVTSSYKKLRLFLRQFHDIVCKPLNNMGGASVFRVKENDVNANVIFEILTKNESAYIMAQQFLPDIQHGDKRILMIDGEPVSHVLARVPREGDWRGNLAAGAKGMVQPLSDHDRWICTQVGPMLRERGLYFVGLDVIGENLTEINVTSPTCIREIDAGANLNISAMLMDCLVSKLPR